MAVDLSKLPPTLPVTVKRVDENGLPSKPLIDWEQYTRDFFKRTTVDLDTRLTTVTATAGANSAAITSETTARANADTAIATQVTALNANVGANTASISSEATTRATADSALASQITTLSTTVAGHTASLSVQAASINGIEVRYSVTGSVGGAFGGFVFSGVEQLGGGAIFGLEIYSNVHIHGDVTIDGTLTTPKAADNAWTDAASVYASGTSVSHVVFLRAGAKVLIRSVAYAGSGYIDTAVLAPPSFIRIFVNGTLFASEAVGVAQDTVWNGSVNTTFWKLMPTPIEYTYVVPATGFYTLLSNLDNGAGASWVLTHGEQAK